MTVEAYNTDQLISSQLVQTDTRGRNYPDNPNSGQGGYRSKAVLLGPRRVRITADNVGLLVMTFNGIHDGNEVAQEDILSLRQEVMTWNAKVEAASTEPVDGKTYTHQQAVIADYKEWADSQYSTTPDRLNKAFVYASELTRYLEDTTAEVYTRRYVFVDAKTNALQHMAYLSGNHMFADFGGLSGKEALDAYTSVGLAAQAWLKSGLYKTAEIKALETINMPAYKELEASQLRKIFKSAVMTRLYGAKAQTISRNVKEEASKAKYDLPEGQAHAYSVIAWYLLQGFLSDNQVTIDGFKTIGLGKAEDTGNSAVVLEDFFSTFSKAYPADEAGFQGFSWKTSPNGFRLFRASRPDDAAVRTMVSVLDVEGNTSNVKVDAFEEADLVRKAINERKLSRQRSTSAASPDLVHSLDGEGIRLMFVAMHELGIKNAHHVHDCIAVQLDDVEKAIEAFRMAHYATYSETGYDPLRFIASQRLEELRLSKPAKDSSEFEAWQTMHTMALEALNMSTAENFLVEYDEAGQKVGYRSLEDLINNIHESAFAPE